MHDVESQLNEAVKAIRQGALPWSMADKPLGELKDYVRKDFEEYYETWNRDRAKVLRMCRYIGTVAAILAEFRNPSTEEPATEPNIPDECVKLAAWLVRIACPAKGEGGIEGIRCSSLGVPEGTLYGDVKAALKKIGGA